MSFRWKLGKMQSSLVPFGQHSPRPERAHFLPVKEFHFVHAQASQTPPTRRYYADSCQVSQARAHHATPPQPRNDCRSQRPRTG